MYAALSWPRVRPSASSRESVNTETPIVCPGKLISSPNDPTARTGQP